LNVVNHLTNILAATRRIFLAVLLMGAAMPIVRSAQAATPEDRCFELYNLYCHYARDRGHHHDGEIARAEFAKYQCETGRAADGLSTLDAILSRNLIPLPKE
jgi:hypothetical protein